MLAPGSLYTSLLPVLCVPELRDALAARARRRSSRSATCGPQVPETNGLDASDHLRAVLEHGGRVDRFLYQEDGILAADEAAIRELGRRTGPGAGRPTRRTGARSPKTGGSPAGSAVVPARRRGVQMIDTEAS